jgi:hypothetical protein
VLNRLHQNIIDVFNEYGVQITSPHFVQEPATSPHIVPKKNGIARQLTFPIPRHRRQAVLEQANALGAVDAAVAGEQIGHHARQRRVGPICGPNNSIAMMVDASGVLAAPANTATKPSPASMQTADAAAAPAHCPASRRCRTAASPRRP